MKENAMFKAITDVIKSELSEPIKKA